jgi:hypothetical protein
MKDVPELVKNSLLYVDVLAEREEILRHKWIESEKAGHDIGFERGLLDWTIKNRHAWREHRRKATQSYGFLMNFNWRDERGERERAYQD